jgi:hypothetical protein
MYILTYIQRTVVCMLICTLVSGGMYGCMYCNVLGLVNTEQNVKDVLIPGCQIYNKRSCVLNEYRLMSWY